MIEPELDTNQKNIIGAIDKFAENIALAALSVFPTFYNLIVKPWHLAPLLINQEPDGRKGMLLGPGVFFIFAIALVMIGAGLFVTPEILKSNGGFLGPAYANRVSKAAADGEIWQVLSMMGPIYILAILFGTIARTFKHFIGPWWTLQTSIRAGFYVMGYSVVWIIASSMIIDPIGLIFGPDISRLLYMINNFPILLIPIWQLFWFVQENNDITKTRAAVIAVAMMALILSIIMGLSEILFLLNPD
jgi:hypothetical protein